MRLCLLPLLHTPKNPEQSFRRLETRLAEIVRKDKPNLVLLPEQTLTGYLYEPADLEKFGEPVPGPTRERMANLARQHRVYLGWGMVEKDQTGHYFNTALLCDRQGRIILHYRRISEKPPFTNGTEVPWVDTELGRLSFLICGDLFHEEVAAKVDRATDWLLYPTSGSLDNEFTKFMTHLDEARQWYLDAVKGLDIPTAMVTTLESLENAVNPSFFCGANVIGADGCLLAEVHGKTDRHLTHAWAKKGIRPGIPASAISCDSTTRPRRVPRTRRP